MRVGSGAKLVVFINFQLQAWKGVEITIIIDSIASKTCLTGNKVLLVLDHRSCYWQPTVGIITFIITTLTGCCPETDKFERNQITTLLLQLVLVLTWRTAHDVASQQGHKIILFYRKTFKTFYLHFQTEQFRKSKVIDCPVQVAIFSIVQGIWDRTVTMATPLTTQQ